MVKIVICISVIILTILSCESNPQKLAPSSTSAVKTDLFHYFEKNKWHYPVEISDSLLPVDTNKAVPESYISSNIQEQLLKWGNNSLSKDSSFEAIKIIASAFYSNKNNDSLIICRVYFYGKRYKPANSNEAAPDYYIIIENRFYRTGGTPVFKVKNGILIFIGYPDYLDMDMLPPRSHPGE